MVMIVNFILCAVGLHPLCTGKPLTGFELRSDHFAFKKYSRNDLKINRVEAGMDKGTQ